MRKTLAAITLVFASSVAFADAKSECEAKAVGKDGKPLAGAARSSFMKKCMSEATAEIHAACEAKAVGKDGKPLAGAARSSFMKKCVAEGSAAK
ncbi:MAG: hypothetical protein N2441_06565 [Rhodocyclaceae bacterium]|nr:hypothetical protein [Rhodocyclaceae bacterium]